MDFFDVVNTRASVRAFEKCEISDDMLVQIMDAGRRAPTAFTVQPWHFILVREQSSLDLLGRVQPCIAQASAAIVAVGDPAKSDFWREDVSAAVENIHMACTALGLDSLWVAVLDKALVNPVLDLPAELVPLAIVPIGKAVAPATQAERFPMGQIFHSEKFGQPYEG